MLGSVQFLSREPRPSNVFSLIECNLKQEEFDLAIPPLQQRSQSRKGMRRKLREMEGWRRGFNTPKR